MKIITITISHKSSDVRVFYKIAKTLAKYNEVTIASPIVDYSIDYKNINIVKIKNNNKILILKQLLKACIKNKPDYIIVVEPLTFIPAIIYKLFNFNTIIVYDCHEFFSLAFAEKYNFFIRPLISGIYRFFESLLCKFSSTIITVNNLHKDYYSKNHSNIVVLRNYPNLKTIEIKKKVYDFIYVGGLCEERGIFKLIKAVKKIAKIYNIKILLIGKFISLEDKERFFSYIKEYKLEKNIKYLSEIDHNRISIYLAKSKFGLSVLSSNIIRYTKTLPLKIPEYLQAGLPVITNDFPIVKDIIDRYNCGFTTKYNSYDILKKMIVALNISESDYQILSSNAKSAVKNELNWDIYEKSLLDIFSKNKRMLYFSYFYPPLGGPGVQRPLKMISEFTQNKWEVDVISVKDIVFHSYDYELLKEDKSTNIFRTKSFDPMSILFHINKIRSKFKRNTLSNKNKDNKDSLYFRIPENIKKILRNIFIIDDKIGWMPYALFKAVKMLKNKKYDVIFATMGPYSSGVSAYILSVIFNKKLVVDYRDHWTLNPYIELISPLHKYISTTLEKKILYKSIVVSVVSKTMKEDLTDKFGKSLSKKIKVVYNGYDENDFNDITVNNSPKLIIRYIGNFYGNRTPEYFCEALSELIDENKIPENVEFSFYGNYSSQYKKILKREKFKNFITINEQVNHREAVNLLMNSSVLLLFIASKKGKGVLTGKIFEYLRSGKDIFCMVPQDGEAEKILKSLGYSYFAEMEDVAQIKATLLKIINAPKRKQYNNNIKKLSRSYQNNKLLEEIEKKLI